MQQTADQVVVIGKGKLIADTPVLELIERSSLGTVRVRVPDPADRADLIGRITAAGFGADVTADDAVIVRSATPEQVGDLAHEAGIRLHELRLQEPSLEEAYMELTSDSVEYGTARSANVTGGWDA
jgi:ABC-2 type transport system ATP-binding protein